MKINKYLTAGVSVVAVTAVAAFTAGASANQIHFPYHKGAKIDPNRQVQHIGPYTPPYVAPKGAKSGTWTDVTTKLPFTQGPWGAMTLTDGSVMIMDYCTSPGTWYKLSPDKKGNYNDGTWTKLATMPGSYSPLFFAQQVLTDGRVIVNGGEYNDCGADWQNNGALYDPQKNSWTAVTAPTGWSTIGDAESIILPNGTYMLANCCDSPGSQALASISGTSVSWTTQATISCNGEPCNDEQGFTALPGGDVLMVDVWNTGSNYDQYEIYNPSTGKWTVQGKTTNFLTNSGFELGSSPLTPAVGKRGTVFQFGADQFNDQYDVATDTWKQGPSFPNGDDCADAPGVTLPSGNILVQASPGEFNSPSHFFEVSFKKKGSKAKITQVNDTSSAANTSSFESNFALLPNGQVIWDNSQASPKEVALYTPQGKAKAKWLPVVSSVSNSLTVGSTGNAISGTNFNGWDLGGVYGDDAQAATNWPTVKITNTGTGDVCYGHSYGFSTMGVWTTGSTNATFDIPSSCEKGASTLQVVVNGIASKSVSVTLS